MTFCSKIFINAGVSLVEVLYFITTLCSSCLSSSPDTDFPCGKTEFSVNLWHGNDSFVKMTLIIKTMFPSFLPLGQIMDADSKSWWNMNYGSATLIKLCVPECLTIIFLMYWWMVCTQLLYRTQNTPGQQHAVRLCCAHHIVHSAIRLPSHYKP